MFDHIIKNHQIFNMFEFSAAIVFKIVKHIISRKADVSPTPKGGIFLPYTTGNITSVRVMRNKSIHKINYIRSPCRWNHYSVDMAIAKTADQSQDHVISFFLKLVFILDLLTKPPWI